MPRPSNKERNQRIIQDHKAGSSTREIAKSYSLSMVTIWNICNPDKAKRIAAISNGQPLPVRRDPWEGVHFDDALRVEKSQRFTGHRELTESLVGNAASMCIERP